jgi:cellulose synthase operon protein YhjU
MKTWSLYFLLVAVLHFSGRIQASWWMNLLLALWIMLPVRDARLLIARQASIFLLAASLLYYESYLPGYKQVLSQLTVLGNFSFDYLQELADRLYNPMLLLAAVSVVLLYQFLHKRIRFTTLGVGAIAAIALQTWQPLLFMNAEERLAAKALSDANAQASEAANGVSTDPSRQLADFYAAESKRKVSFPGKLDSTLPFDIVVLHVCSLAWDDLDFVNERSNPFMSQMDYLFSHFNTAASYSGQAALRILYGGCGQKSQQGLYGDIDPQCKVFPDLEKAGFNTQALLNHDGKFDDFAKTLQERTGFGGGKLTIDRNAPVHQNAFDGAPIYDDYMVLSNWYEKHAASTKAPLALYYNTISLHDGNRVPGLQSNRSVDTFRPRVRKLFDDFTRFIQQIEKRGRPTVLIMIPEHGASLRADKMQISGMREIPTPRITQVPAAIRLIAPNREKQKTVVIDESISYIGVFGLVAEMVRQSPFRPDAGSFKLDPQKLEKTRMVSENGEIVMMQGTDGRYLMQSGNGVWVNYKE